MSGKSPTAESIRASVIRRPTGSAPATRAGDTFQRPTPPTPPLSPDDEERRRTTVVYPATLRRGLKSRAGRDDTTVTALVYAAISAGLADPAKLAAASRDYKRVTGHRTTLDLPTEIHRALKVLAGDELTTVQALVLAAIYESYPDLLV